MQFIMEAFLQECKDNLDRLDDFSTVKVVMGNESCDLDSAVCSLVHAQLLRESLGPSLNSTVVLPVLNIPQSDLPLKTEIMFYFSENDVPLDLLIFRDQIDLRALSDAGKLQLTLVDFHVLTPEDDILKPSVVEVIDHRPQELGWEWPGRRVTMEIVGSCSTLIARKVLEKAPGLLTPQVALLLFADHHIAAELENLLPGISRDEVFQLLHHARSNTQGLSAAQLLIKDLKVVGGHTPMPSMQLLLQEYFQRPNAMVAIQELCTSGNYQQAVLMGMKVDETTKDVTREIAVYSSDPDTAVKLAELLETSENPPLQLIRLELPQDLEDNKNKLLLFNQSNVKASRKQVLPIVRSFKLESEINK
ncbi:hypothetical protein B566_EDAN008076 [Ephemera danica]|nr:hypothetical protein B566_EDAN008076 [Ephemera danica]